MCRSKLFDLIRPTLLTTTMPHDSTCETCQYLTKDWLFRTPRNTTVLVLPSTEVWRANLQDKCIIRRALWTSDMLRYVNVLDRNPGKKFGDQLYRSKGEYLKTS